MALPAWAVGLALFGISAVVLTALIFSAPGFAGNDDYYHAKMARLLLDQAQVEQARFAIDFQWLPYTILDAERFVDHHLLYHLYLAPFVHFGGINGAKVAQIAIAAAMMVAVWGLLRQIKVKHAALWALLIFGLSEAFLYRTLMIRTQGASTLLLILALMVLFRREYRWLIPLSFAYAWLYNGFVLMPATAALYVGATRVADRKFDPRPLVYALVGIGLGLVINPYFPRNLAFIADHLGAKVDFESGVAVGNEWYPYSTGVLLANSGGALLVLLVGFLRSSFGTHKRDRIENTLLLVALLTLFMLLRSRRFIEYFPPFALLFCAAAWGRHPVDFSQWIPRRLTFLVPVTALVIAGAFVGSTVLAARDTIRQSDDPRRFAGASEWLRMNTPEGAMVFQTDWDDFTDLFYYNTWNTYLVGLDPTYLQYADPALWVEWVAITRGEVDTPSAAIRDRFGARYVVSDRSHEAFAEDAFDDPAMRLVYWDANAMVWEVE